MGLAFVWVAALAMSPAIAADTAPHLDTSGVNMQPAYPASALQASERGAAVIGVHVNEAGKVAYAFPLQTSGFADLDRAAIAGVMGWRFIPATSGGKNIPGDTAVEIAFQPPDTPNGPAAPAAPPPKPAGDFLTKSFQIEAGRGQWDHKVGAVPCASGTLRSTVEILHSEGPDASEWKPAASLIVQTGADDWVKVEMIWSEWGGPQRASFALERHQGNDEGALGYAHSMPASPQTMSLSWDTSGLVTATIGAMEKHQAKLRGAPTEFSFAMSSGKATFTNSTLICTPGTAH